MGSLQARGQSVIDGVGLSGDRHRVAPYLGLVGVSRVVGPDEAEWPLADFLADEIDPCLRQSGVENDVALLLSHAPTSLDDGQQQAGVRAAGVSLVSRVLARRPSDGGAVAPLDKASERYGPSVTELHGAWAELTAPRRPARPWAGRATTSNATS